MLYIRFRRKMGFSEEVKVLFDFWFFKDEVCNRLGKSQKGS